MEKDIETWNETGLDIRQSDEKRDCISNLCFADDVLMMATSLEQFKRMMTDFKKSTEARGLQIYPDKTKVLTDQKSNRLKEIEIDGIHVDDSLLQCTHLNVVAGPSSGPRRNISSIMMKPGFSKLHCLLE